MKIIKVNKSLFSTSTIGEAMEAYKDYALIVIKQDAGYTVLTFLKSKFDEEQTIKEFENYMIELENVHNYGNH
ncbi:MAG: HxsD-like protein [Bacilli bacterium]